MKMINYSFNVEKFCQKRGAICPIYEQIFPVKNESFNQAKKLGILSQFVSIRFEIDRIVRDRANITVT